MSVYFYTLWVYAPKCKIKKAHNGSAKQQLLCATHVIRFVFFHKAPGSNVYP